MKQGNKSGKNRGLEGRDSRVWCKERGLKNEAWGFGEEGRGRGRGQKCVRQMQDQGVMVITVWCGC